MQKKRRRLPKKRGRSQKIKKKVEEEEEEDNNELETNSSDGDGDASSPGPASASSDAPLVARCQTRYGKALADKQAALKTPPRILLQNDDGNTSGSSTLSLVKQVLFGENRLDTVSTVPVEAVPSKSPVQTQDLRSQNENISPDKSIGARGGMTIPSKTGNQPVPQKNVLDLKKFTSDLLAQARQPELPIQAASSCSDEIMVNNNLPDGDANVISNNFAQELEDTADGNAQTFEHPTRSSIHNIPKDVSVDDKSSENNELISDPRNPFVDVDGYQVKQELEPLLRAIFRKYGDIAKESTFSMESRSCLLELVCSIYRRLEASRFMQLTPLELQSLHGQIGDLELVRVEVGWLHKRLNQISKARQMYDGASTLKDVEARTVQLIDEKQKAVQRYEKDLEPAMAAVQKLHERLQQEKEELAAALSLAGEIQYFFDGSLVHGTYLDRIPW